MDTNEIQDIEQDLKREKRRRRRRLNRLMAIMVVIIFVALIALLGVFVYMKIDEIQKESEHQDIVTEKLEELTEDETEVPVVSEPDIEEEKSSEGGDLTVKKADKLPS